MPEDVKTHNASEKKKLLTTIVLAAILSAIFNTVFNPVIGVPLGVVSAISIVRPFDMKKITRRTLLLTVIIAAAVFPTTLALSSIAGYCVGFAQGFCG
ncbi:MAG: hypothetical protein WC360_06590 [Opitutales bacterium]|jgi:predicted secreted protein